MLKMKNELYFYDIYPKVIPVGKEVPITIKALSLHVYFEENASYDIDIYPINADIYSQSKDKIDCVSAVAHENTLKFSYNFKSEQEYSIRICKHENENDSNHNWLAYLSVYALDEDLMARKPLIGDFHIHSCFSDGREGPDFVAAMYRQNGFDFAALTDHHCYKGSVYALDKYKDIALDFKLYHGEEIHTEENHVHLVNFGSDFSVNDYCFDDSSTWESRDLDGVKKQRWYKEVAEIQSTLGELPYGVDPFIHASCLLAIKKVHEGNGMCIFPHPHWLADVRNVTDGFTEFYLRNSFADAFELIGGQTWHENMTQIAFYNELRAQGCKIPIVGDSDSHGTVNPMHGNAISPNQYFTEEKTMVFALNNERDDIISAVKNLYSVAVDHYTGQDFHINGPYRLVQYALFIMENYIPLHNELCYEEGRLMRMYINGSEEAQTRLNALKGQTERLYEKYFMR